MIEVKHLCKRYGEHVAVDDLSFTIENGHVYGFLGPNGAGKSTTMNILTGCLAATSGTVSIDGFDIFEDAAEAKSRIGYLPEIPPLYQDMTVREYLTFVAKAKGVGRKTQTSVATLETAEVADGAEEESAEADSTEEFAPVGSGAGSTASSDAYAVHSAACVSCEQAKQTAQSTDAGFHHSAACVSCEQVKQTAQSTDAKFHHSAARTSRAEVKAALASYGLDKPQMSFTAKGKQTADDGGSTAVQFTLQVGSKIGSSYYVRLKDSKMVYTVSADEINALCG